MKKTNNTAKATNTEKTVNKTELVFILDESGSMASLRSDTIGGFNTMLDKQRGTGGEAFVTTVMFSDTSKVVHDRKPLSEVADLTADDYAPMGCTALYDAVGETVKHISGIHKYARKEDVPDKTLFVITTDGMENASRKYNAAEVKKLIEAKQEEGWEFIFLGANIDAAAAAADIGICEDKAVNYKASSKGTAMLFRAVGAAVSMNRRSKAMTCEWREELDAENKA
ncbi:MAG: VWA domain-containing protein [Ruminococcus sp.]|nr:VWA domain-containing protein [Ruminococcus sp.]